MRKFNARGSSAAPERRRLTLRPSQILSLAVTALLVVATAAWAANRSGVRARTVDAGAGSSGTATVASAGKAVNGGTLRAGMAADPDHLDPGLGYTNESWEIEEATGDGLLAYRRTSGQAGSQIVPDLATAMPKVTDHGLLYTFHVRTDVKFSPPVNRIVEPSDIKFSIERLFRINSGGESFYTGIVGANRYAKARKGGISGIVANDSAHTISFRLTHADGTFLNYLAMPFSFALPVGTPNSDTSTNAKWRVATGPYMISSYVPQSQIVLVRNPNFHQWSPNIPGGHLDKIEVTIGVSADQAVTEIADGRLDWYFEAVAPDRLAQLKAQYPSQLYTFNPEEVWFFTLNTRKPPFNNVLVRQAVNYATSRTALVKIFGGQGAASQSIVPKGIGGYVATNFYPYNLKKAKRLVAKSHTKGMAVTVWGADFDPIPRAVQYMASVLDSLGYKASVKTLSASVYYDTMAAEKTDPQISWNNWGEDFPDAEDFIDTQLNGENITSVGNNNQSNLDVPAINHAIDAARLMPVGPARTSAWERINTQISKTQAPMVVYMDSLLPKFVSPKLHGLVFNGTFYELLPSMWLSK